MSTSGPLSELLARWEQLRAQGVTLSAEELCHDTPELLEQFREALTALKYVGQMMGTSTGTVADPFRVTRPARAGEEGTDLPGYEILGELGKGGIGVVYLARSVRLDRLVALKMLRAGAVADAAELERFRREGQAMARLEHPHVVPVFAADEHEGRPYFTMKLLKGGNLAEHLPALTRDPRRAVAVLEKVARAVHYLHQQKILHRDLKPLNILLDEGGEPYVSDFGLAKFLEPGLELTTPGAPLGTWPYMAPEQVLGQHHLLGPATDVWALGVILYEVLTGRRPFAGEDKTDMVKQILTAQPAPPRSLRPDLDEGLECVVARCLQKEPASRYSSAGALADDLAAALRGDRRAGRPLGPRSVRTWVRRHRYQTLGACLFLSAWLVAWVAGLIPFGNTGDSSEYPKPPAPESVITLVPATGPPPQWDWRAGESNALTGQAADGAFSLAIQKKTPKLALLELRQAAPWPRFRFEAQIRHDEGADGGTGIYFGYRKHRCAGVDYHSFCKVQFADRGQGRGRTQVELTKCRVASPDDIDQISCAAPFRFGPPGKTGRADGWRTLAVEVTPLEVRAYWGGQCCATVEVGELRRLGTSSLPDWPQNGWHSAHEAGLGVFVERGSASFKEVKINPLPEPPG